MSLSTCGEGILPGRTSSNTESYVSFLREGVVSKLSQVLWSQVLVRFSCQCILTCQQKKELLHPSERLWSSTVNMNGIQKPILLSSCFQFFFENMCTDESWGIRQSEQSTFWFHIGNKNEWLDLTKMPPTDPTILQQSLAHFPNSFMAADSCSFCLDYIII